MLWNIVPWETHSESCIYLLLSPEISGRMYKYNPHKNYSHANSQLQIPKVCKACAKQHFTICTVHLGDGPYSGYSTWGSLLHRVSLLFFFFLFTILWVLLLQLMYLVVKARNSNSRFPSGRGSSIFLAEFEVLWDRPSFEKQTFPWSRLILFQ